MIHLGTVILLFSSVFCLIESFSKLEDVSMSKNKHQDNNTAYKNGDPCKYAVASIEADVTAHNLVKVKWKIELQGYCQINKMEVKMFEKYSRKCLLLLVLYKRMKISKNVETDNCRERKHIRLKSLASGELLQFWRHSSVHVQGVIVTSHGKISMNDGDYSSSNLIDTLANTEEVITTCFYDCTQDGVEYKGIRSIDDNGDICDKWSQSEEYSKKAKYNTCYKARDESTAWCPSGKNSYQYCQVPYCSDYPRFECIRYVNTSSTSDSISGKFRSDMTFHHRYLMLLFDVADEKCIDYIKHGKIWSSYNVKTFTTSCGKKKDSTSTLIENSGSTYKNFINFTFMPINSDTKYEIYIIPFYENVKEMKVAYYPQITAKTKPGPVTNATVKPLCASKIKVNWKAPKKGYVEKYKIILKKYNEKSVYQTTKEKSVEFKNLKASTKYCVTIAAINNGGSSSVSEEFCGETYEQEPGPVTRITANPVSSSSIKYFWEAPKRGYVEKYRIILKQNNEMKFNETTKDKYVEFENLKECMDHCVTVIALNKGGPSVPKYICKKTLTKKPGPVTSITVKSMSLSSIKVKWEESDIHLNSKTRSYEINLIVNNETERQQVTEKKSAIFEKLRECTEYCVRVTAISNCKKSVSEEFCMKAFAKEPGRVTNATLNPESSSSIKVKWEDPDIHLNSKTRSYEVHLIVNNVKERQQVTEQKSAIFHKLRECTEYCVRVTVIINCKPSEDVCRKTLARGEGHITLGKIQNGTHLYRNISWWHSWSENCVDYYIVSYWKKNEKNTSIMIQTNKTMLNLDKLQSNTQFEVQVKAKLYQTESGNNSAISNTISFQTGNAEGAKNIPLITFLCVLVAFIVK